MTSGIALVWAVARKEYQESTCRWTALLRPGILVALFALSILMAIRVMPGTDNVEIYTLVAEAAVTDYFLAVCLLCMVPLLPLVFEKEKLAGTMEFLLASPAGPHAIWIGKATFLFLWAYSWALVYLVASATILFWQFRAWGLPFPFASTTAAFLLMSPLVCIAFALLVSELSMVFSSRIVSFLSTLAVMGFLFLMVSSAKLRSALSTEARLVMMALPAVVVVVICVALSSMLSRERVLLAHTK